MNKLSLIIIDDEQPARNLLKEMLSGIFWIEVLGEADHVDSAFEEIMNKKPDVILLDIHLQEQNGFDLVEKLIQHEVKVKVIFISAFENYAIQAIRASAFDYLLKPVKKQELIQSLEILSKQVKSFSLEDRFSQLIYQLSDRKKIKFRNRNGFIMIHPDEIIFCRADSNYTILQFDDGRSYTVSMNFGAVEEVLPELCFSRINRSLIINLHYLSEVDRKSMTCKVSHGTTHLLPISRKYLQTLEIGCNRHFSIKDKRHWPG
ncbi:MAG: LytTR family DNA-binding domain-containing protein [Bacteroidales bacterium]